MDKPQVDVTRSGDTVIFSVPVTVTGERLNRLKLDAKDSLMLTLKMEMDVNRLAAIIEKEGGGKSDPSLPRRVATAVTVELIKDMIAEAVKNIF
jgi:hypothetical protein